MGAAAHTADNLSAGSSEDLAAYFGAQMGSAHVPKVTHRELASQGFSDDTLFLTLRRDDGTCDELVIRRYRSGGLLREETDPERQYRVLKALQNSTIPVPEVLWFEGDEAVLGAPFFVMRRVHGFVPLPWSAEGRNFLARVGAGATGMRFVELLTEIHRLDWRAQGLAFLGAPAAGQEFAMDRVDVLEGMLRRYQDDPEPVFADAIGWLRANLPVAARTSLVHGDYRAGNVIYDDERIVAVLDWEFTKLGDPIMDIAWVCAPSNRMESELVSYLMPQDRFIDLYERYSGSVVDPSSLQFWLVYHQCWHGLMWLSGAAAYARGETKDLRLARMAYTLPVMRRMVADLLEYP